MNNVINCIRNSAQSCISQQILLITLKQKQFVNVTEDPKPTYLNVNYAET